MIFDGFLVLSNTDRTWFSMFFIKNHNFRVFQENLTLLPFDRSPKSSETSHFRCCQICYWQQDISDEPKRWIWRKIAEIIRFFVSGCQCEKLPFADFGNTQFEEFCGCTSSFVMNIVLACLKCVVQPEDTEGAATFWNGTTGDKAAAPAVLLAGHRLESRHQTLVVLGKRSSPTSLSSL